MKILHIQQATFIKKLLLKHIFHCAHSLCASETVSPDSVGRRRVAMFAVTNIDSASFTTPDSHIHSIYFSQIHLHLI